MANSVEIHVNDVGVDITLTVKENGSALDISTATSRTIWLIKPDGTATSYAADLVGGGTTGQMKITTSSGNLNVMGRWLAQGKFTLGSWTGRTVPVEFDVGPEYT